MGQRPVRFLSKKSIIYVFGFVLSVFFILCRYFGNYSAVALVTLRTFDNGSVNTEVFSVHTSISPQYPYMVKQRHNIFPIFFYLIKKHGVFVNASPFFHLYSVQATKRATNDLGNSLQFLCTLTCQFLYFFFFNWHDSTSSIHYKLTENQSTFSRFHNDFSDH